MEQGIGLKHRNHVQTAAKLWLSKRLTSSWVRQAKLLIIDRLHLLGFAMQEGGELKRCHSLLDFPARARRKKARVTSTHLDILAVLMT
jgi:hypothetical protein